jgi:hypothetical protein
VALASKGVNPTTIPIFLLYNVVLSSGTPTLNHCCLLGYHSSAGSQSAPQTYTMVDFDSSQSFKRGEDIVQDIAVISHEIGELWNDPIGNNQTPGWGHTGQVSGGCQFTLEVGDPLTGTPFPAVTMPNGIVYHPQELAFFSWFFRQSPSLGSGGQYSNNGTFASIQGTCN